MPIYEYECLKCNKIFEELQSFSDKDVTKCPHCKKAFLQCGHLVTSLSLKDCSSSNILLHFKHSYS